MPSSKAGSKPATLYFLNYELLEIIGVSYKILRYDKMFLMERFINAIRIKVHKKRDIF